MKDRSVNEDEDEDELRRPLPLLPYRPVPSVLSVPAKALNGTLSLLQRPGAFESGAIWYGDRLEDGGGVVRLVVAPRQIMRRFNYEIPADAVAEIVRQLPESWRPLAQVHSHPGGLTEHSRYDDRMALSRRALSIVFPSYGRYRAESFPAGVGVHECQEGYWHLLADDLAAVRVQIAAGDQVQIADLR